MMHGLYVLDEHDNPVEATDVTQWATFYEQAPRRFVACDKIGDATISTVFLAIDHAFGGGPPILYETLVMRPGLADEQERYATREEALKGHARMCAMVKEARPR